MKQMNTLFIVFSVSALLVSCTSSNKSIELYGSMREALGQQRSEGRVKLVELSNKANYVGVGALAGLAGEITLIDRRTIVSTVGEDGKPKPSTADISQLQATLFVGAQVDNWIEVIASQSMNQQEFEAWVRKSADGLGLNPQTPFMFKLAGELQNVRSHVIKGACPLHARINKKSLPKEQLPYEGEFKTLKAEVVGVYASDAVGKLNHPDTAIHSHVVYSNGAGSEITAHLEEFSLAKGSKLYLPRN
jgi:alpha-acetolactate decarboxylase